MLSIELTYPIRTSHCGPDNLVHPLGYACRRMGKCKPNDHARKHADTTQRHSLISGAKLANMAFAVTSPESISKPKACLISRLTYALNPAIARASLPCFQLDLSMTACSIHQLDLTRRVFWLVFIVQREDVNAQHGSVIPRHHFEARNLLGQKEQTSISSSVWRRRDHHSYHISPHCAITMSATGLLSPRTRVFSTLRTTSIPSMTLPKTTCLPFRKGVGTWVDVIKPKSQLDVLAYICSQW